MEKLTTEEFIQKAKAIHGDKYDYSKVQYVDAFTKVCIICPVHGEFMQTAHNHLRGAGCSLCGRSQASYSRRKSNADFIAEANKVHGNQYDYSKVSYVDAKSKVIIICPKHGEFQQSPSNHLNGTGCPKCSHERIGKLSRNSKEWFIEKAHEVHGDRYDYSKVEYHDSSQKVCIICKEHGEFWQLPHAHLKGHGCPICAIEQNTKYTKEECLLAAQKCSSRVEFYKKYPSLSLSAKYHGWYEECCAHMGRKGNKQRIIYVYEFEPSHAAYIGLTFKMEVRDKRHHKEGSVYEYAKQHNISIPTPKILTDYLQQEEASIQEGVWTQYYKDQGWKILNKIKTGSLGGQETLDYTIEKIEDSMKGYDSLTVWAEDYSSYREYIRQHALDYLLDKHFPDRMKRIYDNYDACRNAYSNCDSISAVHEKFPGALAAAKRHGWHEEFSKLCIARAIERKQDAFRDLIKHYKTLKEFRHAHPTVYNYIRNKGWNDLLAPLTRQLHPDYHFTIDQIKALCDEAGSHEILKENHPEVLSYCWHNSIDIYALTGWTKSHLRPIRLIKDGIVVATFASTKEAAEYVGVRRRNAGRYIDKGIEYHGYIWETNN